MPLNALNSNFVCTGFHPLSSCQMFPNSIFQVGPFSCTATSSPWTYVSLYSVGMCPHQLLSSSSLGITLAAPNVTNLVTVQLATLEDLLTWHTQFTACSRLMDSLASSIAHILHLHLQL